MKRSLRIAVLCLLALILAAGPALAANNIEERNGQCFNASTHQRVDCTTGAVIVEESAPLTGYVMIAPAFLSTAFMRFTGTLAAINGVTYVMKDSSGVEDTQGYNRLGLLVYPTFDDSTGSVLLAFSVRMHQSASHDTLSTYTLPKLRTLTAPSDTVGSFLDRLESAAMSTSSGAMPYERYLVLSHMNGPRGIFIPLTDRDGANLAGNKISVQWRTIATYKPDLSAAWTVVQDPKTFIRADLVGRRD